MKVEQNLFTRKKPNQLVYLELGSGNGGMLLSTSEEGFRFRAVSPVRASGPMPFAFSLDGTNRLEGSGEIEWLDDDGKSGGLRFTDVTDEFRAAINAWLSSDSSSHLSGREVAPAASIPLDTMEKIRQDLRAGIPTSPRKPQPVAPPSNAASIPAAIPEKKAAPVIPDRKKPDPAIPDRPVPDRPVPNRSLPDRPIPDRPVPNRALPNRSVPDRPIPDRPVADRSAANRTAPDRPGVERIIPEQKPKPLFSERLPEPKETQRPVRPLFSHPLPSVPETEKPAALSSAFLKLAHETKAPPRAPVAPAAPVVSVPPAARITPVATEMPAETRVTESVRPHVPPLEVSFEQAWEHAKLTPPAEPPHLSRATAGSIIAIALAVILGALVYNFRQDIGGIFIELGQRISGGNRSAAPSSVQEGVPENKPAVRQNAAPTLPQLEPESQNLPAGSGSGGNPTSTSPTVSAAAAPSTGATGEKSRNAAAGKAQSASSVRVPAVARAQENSSEQNSADAAGRAGTPPEAGAGQEEFDGAQEILRGSYRQRDFPRAVYLLWASVKKGYVPAEVTLGDLYRRGDGVVKNCDQARVLLVAASKKGSAEARQKLEQMAEQSCE